MVYLNIYSDSQGLRLSRFILGTAWQRRFEVRNVVAQSGIKISQLRSLIKQGKITIETDSINLVFIATNDVKAGRSFQQLKKDFLALMATLRRVNRKNARLVLVTIPPFPKFHSHHPILQTIDLLNRLISSVKADNVRYITWQFSRDADYYFEQYYGNTRRVDKIHLNSKGFDLLLQMLCTVTE